MLYSNEKSSIDDKKLLLDVGGTFIKCSDSREIAINSNGSREEIIDSFTQAVGDFCTRAIESVGDLPNSVQESPNNEWGIAIAIPGPFDYTNGVFKMKHKFSAVFDESFREVALIPEFVKLHFTHDVNCMLSGEIAYGNAKDYSRVALVTLGTGLGFSMYIDGEILCNDMGSPLHAIYNRPYKDGMLEDYASKRGIMSIYQSLSGNSLTVREIAMKAYDGDSAAVETFNRVAATLSEALYGIMDKFKIECLLFGGQISRSFSLMEPILKRSFANLNSMKLISTISDFDNATFNGLRSLFEC